MPGPYELVSVSFVAQKKKRMNVKCRKVNIGGKKKDLEIRVEYLCEDLICNHGKLPNISELVYIFTGLFIGFSNIFLCSLHNDFCMVIVGVHFCLPKLGEADLGPIQGPIPLS